MKINSNIAISDSGFIFNPTSGDSFSTNPIGHKIISLMKEGKSKNDIIGFLTENYQVDKSTAEKDLGDFLLMLTTYQLLRDDA